MNLPWRARARPPTQTQTQTQTHTDREREAYRHASSNASSIQFALVTYSLLLPWPSICNCTPRNRFEFNYINCIEAVSKWKMVKKKRWISYVCERMMNRWLVRRWGESWKSNKGKKTEIPRLHSIVTGDTEMALPFTFPFVCSPFQ